MPKNLQRFPVIKTTIGEICKTIVKVYIFQKRATDIYIQEYCHSYINREEHKNILTELKYQNLKESENMQVLAKTQLSSHKLASRTAKWYNTKREEQFWNFCSLCNLCKLSLRSLGN